MTSREKAHWMAILDQNSEKIVFGQVAPCSVTRHSYSGNQSHIMWIIIHLVGLAHALTGRHKFSNPGSFRTAMWHYLDARSPLH